MKKKILSLLLALALVFTAFALPASAKEAQPHYFVLGDSIAEGFGVTNRDACSYGKIIADTNGYTYANSGRMGYDSADILRLVTTRDNIRDEIRKADIISISVGGNDFLLNNAPMLLVNGLIFHNYKRYDEIAAAYAENLDGIIKEIKVLNPDAVILMQTIYNSWNSFAAEAFQYMIDRVNGAIKAYQEANPGCYEIVDVEPVISHRKDCISTDTVHPNALGNVEIARTVQQKLFDLGLASTTEVVLLEQGIDRDYLIEYFPAPWGKVITFLANWATGNLK